MLKEEKPNIRKNIKIRKKARIKSKKNESNFRTKSKGMDKRSI